MSAIPAETIPTTWVEERDVPFFRMTALIFPASFVAGASALLAGYDQLEFGGVFPADEDADDLMAIFAEVLRQT